MKNNRIIIFVLAVCLSALFPINVHAGEKIWGPQKFVRGEGEPVEQSVTFSIDNPKGEFWLRVENGGYALKPGAKPGILESSNLVSSAVITLNGKRVAGPEDFNQQVDYFTKDIALQGQNTITVKLMGKPGSFITLNIIRKSEANLNANVDNATGDLTALNMRDEVVLWWEQEDKASEYVIYRSYSKDGPWNELGRIPLSKGVDATPEAATRDLYYKIEALDAEGKVIRRYPPVCVPKYRTLEDVQ